jgi:hypothetical protein
MAINSFQDVQNALTEIQNQGNDALNNLSNQINSVNAIILDYFKKAVSLINEKLPEDSSRAFMKGFDPSKRGINGNDSDGVTWDEIYNYLVANILPSEYIDIIPNYNSKKITIELKIDDVNEKILNNVINTDGFIDIQFNEASGHLVIELNVDTLNQYLEANGITGQQGEQGVQGIQGIQGEQGEQGIQGEQGEKGDPGDPGTGLNFIDNVATYGDLPASANQGDAYFVEDDDLLYIWGASGFPPQGEGALWRGAKGEQGVQGIQGDQGEQGIQGVQGIQGIQGQKGDKGDPGDAGTLPGDGVLTIKLGDETIGTFTANQSTNTDTIIDLSNLNLGNGNEGGSIANMVQFIPAQQTQGNTINFALNDNTRHVVITPFNGVNQMSLNLITNGSYRDLFVYNTHTTSVQVFIDRDVNNNVKSIDGGSTAQAKAFHTPIAGRGFWNWNANTMTIGRN